MTLKTNEINGPELLWHLMGSGDETKWNEIVSWANSGGYMLGFPDRLAYGVSDVHLDGATLVFNNNLPRISFADGLTQACVFVLWPTYRWLTTDINITWVNDHSAGGNVRWNVTHRRYNYGSAITAPVVTTSLTTQVAPAAGVASASVLMSAVDTSLQGFGHIQSLRIERIGGDGADTVGGPVAITSVVPMPHQLSG